VSALIRYAASPIVFKGCDWEPVFLSSPFLALMYNSSAEQPGILLSAPVIKTGVRS